MLISIALIAGGCATLPGRRQFDGFSIMPPEGEGWTASAHPERGIPVAFSLGGPTREHRTVVAMVTQTYLALPTVDRAQLMQRLIESIEPAQWGSPRYKRIAFETSEDRSLGADCIRYVATSEDRGVPGYPVGSLFILEVRGVRCVHPSDPHLLLDISHSQRFPRGQAWDPVFDAKLEPFLTSLTFTPPPESERRWEVARVQRMELAGKQAWEKGNLAEAERLCVEVLQYVGASTVNSLYEYAALLKALKRQDAEAAWVRAEKLREAKSQPGPGSVFLGFRPFDELKRYADLLEELGRGAEAESMRALATADDRADSIHFIRLQEQARGRDPRGIC